MCIVCTTIYKIIQFAISLCGARSRLRQKPYLGHKSNYNHKNTLMLCKPCVLLRINFFLYISEYKAIHDMFGLSDGGWRAECRTKNLCNGLSMFTELLSSRKISQVS